MLTAILNRREGRIFVKRLRAAWHVLNGTQRIPSLGQWTMSAWVNPDTEIKAKEWLNMTGTFSLDILGDWHEEKFYIGGKLNNHVAGRVANLEYKRGDEVLAQFNLEPAKSE